MNFEKTIQEATPLLLQGMRITILISVISILIGMAIGLVACFMGISRNKFFKALSGIYVWVIRGTPMIVQAFIVYFGIPQLIQMFSPDFKLEAFTAGVITLSFNAGAYISEIFRGGISAVPKGQVEAARSLGTDRESTYLRLCFLCRLSFGRLELINTNLR